MSFELRNAGATYKWPINRMFSKQIGRSMKVCVDNMQEKSKKVRDHIQNLAKIFNMLRHYSMNLKKYSFVSRLEKFLGCVVIAKGIKQTSIKSKSSETHKSL